ncbi:MAG: tetratricopeptide repeat protein [Deltaproteobacteria bacterium]|nr:tetratricopeptide repeat protein [Deltaproteobacteria bacterium]
MSTLKIKLASSVAGIFLASNALGATKTSTTSDVDPREIQPPAPPTAEDVDKNDAAELHRRDVESFAVSSRSYREDSKELTELRFAQERARIESQYQAPLSSLEDEERVMRKEAVERFETFLHKYPNDASYTPDAMFRLAELLFETSSDEYLLATRDYDLAIRKFEPGPGKTEPAAPKPAYERTIGLYKDLLKRFPKYENADAALYLLGYSNEEQDDIQGALVLYRQLVETYTKSRFLAEVWTRIGEIYFDENRATSLEQAADAYRHVLEFKDSPYYDKALYKLAWTDYRLDHFDDAVASFIRLVEFADEQKAKTGKSGSELRAEAIQYIAFSLSDEKWGGVNKADAVLGKLKDKPYAAEMWKRYGEILFDQTDFPKAIEVLGLALQKFPNHPQNPEIQSTIVTAYERQRDFEGATRAREKLVSDYWDGTPWFIANKDNSEAIAQARELAEKALYKAALFNHNQAQVFKKANRMQDAAASYKRASANYRDYLTRFPGSQHTYDFSFYLAECLYYSDDFIGAASQYAKVRDMGADGKHIEASALSAVISLEKEIERLVGAKQLPDYEVKTGERDKVEPKEIAPIRTLLVSASDRFVELLPKSDRAPAISYRTAELFYRHDRLEEARKRFEKILEMWPESEVARYSANLMIDSFLAQKDYMSVQLWAQRLMEIFKKTDVKDAKEKAERTGFLAGIEKFLIGSIFRIAESLDQEGKYEDAANKYVELVDRNPSHEFADKALFNAAIDYEKVRRFETASKIYQRIFDSYPKSDLADRALFRVGVNYEKGFDFQNAIAAYNKLVDRYQSSKFRADAMYNLSVTYENMQQYVDAAASFKKYARTFPDREDAGEVFYRSALVYEKMKAWNDMISTLQAFIGKYKKDAKQSERVIEAQLKMGQAYLAQNKSKQANDAFDLCVKEFARRAMKPEDRASADAAKCALELAEDKFRIYDAVQIKGSSKQQEGAFKKKATLQRDTETAYREVFQYKRADTTLAALYRMGHTYERFAFAMYNAEIPPELKKLKADIRDEAIEEYKSQLVQQAEVLEKKAETAYRAANDEAIKSKVTNQWTQKILEGLNRYAPEEFPVQKAGKPALQTFAITGHGLDDLSGVVRGKEPPPPAPPKEDERVEIKTGGQK